ncbi:TonB-dependent receptor domain-containing protein [Roseateles depolymerans]|uniref:Uncharacterized protein n=1 Tax=Roseateles depolymerans TaxID=76731 RepID=A0A0U3LPG6_9BURK|nr:TonB-dependent receptor [Roseateles depolymerans]ALV08306.1 hypothetical protein RD2015_3855 [Roseateles depolymerans]REG21470.1 hypothetical protein DES44_0589 [Roseateles depolymerans]
MTPLHRLPRLPRLSRQTSPCARPAALPWLLAAGLLGASAGASAQSSGAPWYLGAALSQQYANNVFRENSAENSDQFTTLTLLGGADVRLGRQRLYANTKWMDNRYNHNDQLNNRGFDIRTGMDWSTVGDLSGNLTYLRKRYLADYNATSQIAPTTDRNIQTDQSAEGTVRLGLPSTTPLALEGGYVYRTRDYSLASYVSQEYRQGATSLGLTYSPSSQWRFGVAGRYTKGHTTDTDFKYSRRDLDLTAGWTLTGSSNLNARISRSNADNFNGVTGSLIWDWRPGGRWNLSTQISRDTGVETYYLGVANVVSDYNRITTSAQVQGSYRLTGKLSLTAGGGYSRVSRDDRNFNTGNSDSSRFYNAGISWQATRAVTVGCSYNRQSRSSYSLLYTYDAYTAGCYVQGVIQ